MTARRPAARFDEIIHAPHRLRICALLAPVESMEFGVVRDELGVADSVLSKQVKVLTDAGYATTSKAAGPSGRARTWLSLTRGGRRAFAAHLEALRELAAAAEGRTNPGGTGTAGGTAAPGGSGSVAGAGVERLDRDRRDEHGQSHDPQE